MPSVPVLQQGGVRESALPNVRVGAQTNVDAFGGGGENVTRAAQGVLDVVDRIRQQAEQTRIQEADNEAARIQNTMLYGDKDGNVTGVKDIQGKDALGITTKYSEEYKKSLADIEKNLASPAQRAAFRQKAELRYNSFNEQLNKHEAAESDKYATSVFKTGIQIARDDAVTNYHDPSKIQLSLLKQKELIKAEGERQGLDAASIELQVKQLASKTHSDIIDRMAMNGDDSDAEKYFNENKDNFVADDLVKNEKFVAENSRLGKSQRFTDDVLSKGISMTAALGKAKEIEDPKLRQETESRIREQYGLREAALDRDKKMMYEATADKLEKFNGSPTEIKAQFEDIKRSKTWIAFDDSHRQAMERRYKQLMGLENESTDPVIYNDFKLMAANPETRKEFLDKNLPEYRSKFTAADYKEMVNMQADLLKGDSSKADYLQTKTSIVNGELAKVGINVNSKDEDDKKDIAEYNTFIDRQMSYKSEQLGRKLNNEEIREIAQRALIEGKEVGTGLKIAGVNIFASRKRVYQLQSGQAVTFDIDDVPARDKATIIAELKAANKPITEQAVANRYAEKVAKGFNRGS